MKKMSIVFSVLMVMVIFIFSRCSDEGEKTGAANEPKDSTVAANYGGFDSQVT